MNALAVALADASPAPPTVAVAIPTYLREGFLLEALKDILAQDRPADEILVIDQTPEHQAGTAAALQRWHDEGRLRWIRHAPPNLPGARNRALAETTCDIVVFIDDDVRLPRDFVRQHVRHYHDASVVGVSGRVIDLHVRWRLPVRTKEWPPWLDFMYFDRSGHQRVEGRAALSGVNHSIRRAAALAAGGYDTNYLGWAFREDSDMGIRLWRNGGLLVHDPDAALTHLNAPTGGCRVGARDSSSLSWRVYFPETYFYFRHLFPRWVFWQGLLFGNYRRLVLSRANVYRPWRLPVASLSYALAAGYAPYRAFLKQLQEMGRAPRERGPARLERSERAGLVPAD